MIRITVEMLPGGNEKKKHILCTGTITNTMDAPGRPRMGNYDVVLTGKTGRVYRKGRVVGWPRTSRHVWQLIWTAIGDAINT